MVKHQILGNSTHITIRMNTGKTVMFITRYTENQTRRAMNTCKSTKDLHLRKLAWKKASLDVKHQIINQSNMEKSH
jgi:hypothetical protein